MARARPRTAAAAATLALAATVLAGCSDDGGTPTSQKTSASSQVNMDMPPGYPKSDVPVLNATILAVTQGTDSASSNWRVLLQSTDPPAKVVDDASGILEDAGWKVGKSPSDTTRTLTRDDGQRVVLTAREKGGGTELLYVIRL
ncbi:hypothetical protein [Nocardioides koreensis]